MQLTWLILFCTFCTFCNVEAIESSFWHGGKFYLLSTDLGTWKDVQHFCNQKFMEMVTFNTDEEVQFFSNQVTGWTWTGYVFNENLRKWNDFKGNIAKFSTSTAATGTANKCLDVSITGGKFNFDSDDCVNRYRYACQSNYAYIDHIYETTKRLNSSIIEMMQVESDTKDEIQNLASIVNAINVSINDINQTISHIKGFSEEFRLFQDNITTAMEQSHLNVLMLTTNYSDFEKDRIKVESEWKTWKDEVQNRTSVTNTKLVHFELILVIN